MLIMKMSLKFLVAGIVFISLKTKAQNSEIVQVADTAYMNVIQQRAAKIVDKLDLGDEPKKTISTK